jgi:hypothetical protein
VIKKIEFSQYNLRLLNFNYIFSRKIEVNIINDLHRFGLLKDRISTNAKKFFYHHIIHTLCEELLNANTIEKTVIYFNNTQIDQFHILKYFKEEEVLKVLTVVLLKIKKLLPIKIYASNISFDFLTHLLSKHDGRGVEVINSIRNYVDSVNIEKYTFAGVRTFTKKNDLVFLNKEYFNQLKTKQLLIS